MMGGAFVLGGLADKLGRKRVLSMSLAINASFASLSSFVQGYGAFLFCRLISGIGYVITEGPLDSSDQCPIHPGTLVLSCTSRRHWTEFLFASQDTALKLNLKKRVGCKFSM